MYTATMVSFKFWYLMMVVTVVPIFCQHMKDHCYVKSFVQMNQTETETLPLLSYVTRSINMTLGFLFSNLKGHDRDWDAVCLNSTGATHSVMRDLKETWIPLDLPRLIPEGWNTFTVALNGHHVTVTLMQGQDQLTLLTLSVPRPVTKVVAKGTIARCPTFTPEWEVAAGDQTEVILQPGGSGHDQWVEVSDKTKGAADPYVSFPSSSDAAMFPVPANTILKVTSTLRGDHAILKVFKVGDGGGEKVMEDRVPITPPMIMLVSNSDGAGNGGSIHLRLLMSPPLKHDNAPVKSSGAKGWKSPVLFSLLAVALVLALFVGAYQWRRRGRRNRLLDKKKSMILETLSSLSNKHEFEGRLFYCTTNGIKELRIHLLSDQTSATLLEKLHEIDISRLDLLLVFLPEAPKLYTVENLPSLPSSQKVKLEVAGFTEGEVTEVCELVCKLEPDLGYSMIDFREESSSSSNIDGRILREEAWEELLHCLDRKEVVVKGKVWLPPGALTEERQQQLRFSFSYGCRSIM